MCQMMRQDTRCFRRIGAAGAFGHKMIYRSDEHRVIPCISTGFHPVDDIDMRVDDRQIAWFFGRHACVERRQAMKTQSGEEIGNRWIYPVPRRYHHTQPVALEQLEHPPTTIGQFPRDIPKIPVRAKFCLLFARRTVACMGIAMLQDINIRLSRHRAQPLTGPTPS